jgi:hypothetical protein
MSSPIVSTDAISQLVGTVVNMLIQYAPVIIAVVIGFLLINYIFGGFGNIFSSLTGLFGA